MYHSYGHTLSCNFCCVLHPSQLVEQFFTAKRGKIAIMIAFGVCFQHVIVDNTTVIYRIHWTVFTLSIHLFCRCLRQFYQILSKSKLIIQKYCTLPFMFLTHEEL